MQLQKDSINTLFNKGAKRGVIKVDVTAKDAGSATTKANITLKTADKNVEVEVKDGDKVELYVDRDATSKATIEIKKVDAPAAATVKAEGNKIVGLTANGYYYKAKDAADTTYVKSTGDKSGDLTDGRYLVKTAVPEAEAGEKSVSSLGEGEKVEIKIPSDTIEVEITGAADAAEKARKRREVEEAEAIAAAEAAKKAEEAKKDEAKKDETKKDESKTDETKKPEETKPEKPSTDDTKAPEVVKPVSKKAKNTASTKNVQAVLDGNKDSKLTVSAAKASVTLSKAVLEAVFGGTAESVKVSVKAATPKKNSKDAKAVAKSLKKNKLVAKTVYNVTVKVGKENINNYDLQDGKLTVTLNTGLKKAPKNLYVMNISNGKLMKASFKSGKVTFKAGMTGKFVVVSK